MGRHGDDTRKRGLAGWLVVSTVGAVLVIVVTAVYFIWLSSDSGSGTVDTSCTGSVRIEVAAGGSATAVQGVADAFNAGNPAARGSCITAEVSSAGSPQIAAALIGGWAGQANPQPAVWIPDNLADLAQVSAADPALVAGYNDTPIATSPVVLAVAADAASTAAAGFSWADLLADESTATIAEDTPITLALGDPRLDRATGYAIESMLAGAAGNPVTIETVTAAAAELSALTRRSAVSSTTSGLLDDLAGGTSSFTAVPVLEANLAEFNRTAGSPLRAIYPTGPTAGDELVAVPITADWVDPTEIEGASAFISYLSSDAGRAVLLQSGLRSPAAAAETSSTTTADGTDTGQQIAPLPAVDSTVLDALATAMGLPESPLGTNGQSGVSSEPADSSEVPPSATTG